jgi:arylformamidase
MTGVLSSIRRAIIWLWNNAESHGVSAERINLCGHSAGGHLTAMAMATDWTALDHDLPHDIVKTGIPISGLYQLEPLRSTTISDVLGLDDDESRSLSPYFAKPATGAPILVTVGGAETGQFQWQTDQFVDKWSKNDIIMGKHVEPGVDHFDIINRLASDHSEIFNTVLHWLK